MNLAKAFTLASVVTMVLAGCGGGKDSTSSPLNSDQKTRFGNTLESFGRATDAALTSRNNSGRTLHALSSEESKKQMAQRLQQSFQRGDCQTSGTKDFSGASFTGSGQQHIFMKINGSSCPVLLNADVSTSFDPGKQVKLEMDLTYSVQDGEYKKLNDVTGFTLKGAMNFDLGADRLKGAISFAGDLNSQQYGNLSMIISGNMDVKSESSGANGGGDVTYTVKYPDFTAQLKAVQTFDGQSQKEEYSLNGQTISRDEFNAWLKKGGTMMPQTWQKSSTRSLIKALVN